MARFSMSPTALGHCLHNASWGSLPARLTSVHARSTPCTATATRTAHQRLCPGSVLSQGRMRAIQPHASMRTMQMASCPRACPTRPASSSACTKLGLHGNRAHWHVPHASNTGDNSIGSNDGIGSSDSGSSSAKDVFSMGGGSGRKGKGKGKSPGGSSKKVTKGGGGRGRGGGGGKEPEGKLPSFDDGVTWYCYTCLVLLFITDFTPIGE